MRREHVLHMATRCLCLELRLWQPACGRNACQPGSAACAPQACRNYAKAIAAAREQGMADGSYTVMHMDLASLDSVRQVCP